MGITLLSSAAACSEGQAASDDGNSRSFEGLSNQLIRASATGGAPLKVLKKLDICHDEMSHQCIDITAAQS